MAEQDRTSFLNEETETYQIYSRKSLGYADGYSRYVKRSGAITKDGIRETITIVKPYPEENVKSSVLNFLLDKPSDTFRKINGYGKERSSTSDAYEDPTFLIFDINLMKFESPLFREDVIKAFLDEYSTLIPEIAEREGYWEEFLNILFKIFPSDISEEGDGIKRHYIESVNGLDVLLKPIINYPEDNIQINVTEDIAMTIQYLAELYNNLVYSYDTHRYLIPENLLRFDMRITVRDFRNMRKPVFNDDGLVKNVINEDISKFIYVLHDCQFNFMGTKNFGTEIKRAGFGAPLPPMSNGGTITINFKSYSKITAPLLIDNSKIVDFRERESDQERNLYRVLFNDVSPQFEVIEKERRKEDAENSILKSIVTDAINEASEVRAVLVNKIVEEANQVVKAGQRTLATSNLGFTLGKVNVYYDSLDEKVTRFAFMFESFLRDATDNLFGRTREIPQRIGNVYNQDAQYNEKFPEGDLHDDGGYNEKFPEGDLHDDGTYNEKEPEGDLHDDGGYNEKFPEGDLHEDGQYNEKFPEGDVHEDGQYNEKEPEGDVHEDGQYNEKFPEGDLHEDGQYNEKLPEGDIHEDGQYNEKFPDGNVYKPKPPSGIIDDANKLGNVYKNKRQ